MKKSYHMISTDCKSATVISVFVSALLVSTLSIGQLNLKVGYTLGFYSPDVSNNILAEFDAQSSITFDQYNSSRPLNLAFGVNLGLRYKFNSSAVEVGWESLARSTSSTGILRPGLPASPTSVTTEFNYRFNMLLLSYESNFGLLGVGSTFGYNLVSIEETIPNSQDDTNLLYMTPDGRDQFFVRFNLSFNITGNETVSFAIKPFIHIPLTEVDLLTKAQLLNVEPQETRESFPAWGISFSFYNGRQ